VPRLRAGRPEFGYRNGQGRDIFSSPPRSDRPIQSVLAVLSPGVEWPRREVDHSLPSAKGKGKVVPVQWVPGLNRPGREAHHSYSSSAEIKNA